MVKIRSVEPEEVHLCAELGLSFYEEADLMGEFNPEVFSSNWTSWTEMGIAVLLGAFDGDDLIGVIGGILSPDPNNGDLVAQEMFWYVMPDRRGVGMRLLLAYKDQLSERGAVRWSMVFLSNSMPERLKKLYLRLGLREQETQYMGTL